MESAQVVIVGAGPSGLVLGLTLSQLGIKSIILEKELGVTQDPRGVYLADDAVRILYDVGLGHRIQDIGHVVPSINFHKTKISNHPFLTLSPNRNHFHQAVPDAVLQSQPKLESALRDAVVASTNCQLRESCEVTGIKDEGYRILVDYTSPADPSVTIECSWLVGADGKKGIVRKYFLEPIANVIQEPGIFPYEATWIAANFKIHIPTPKTHPKFPLWELGYEPKDVYDLFWPIGWHFCSPPGTPVACGRFGPLSDRLWRHEIPVTKWDDSMNALELLMANVVQLITRSEDEEGRDFGAAVQFPLDCIEVIRCRPFRFAHKIVNKWFHNRTIVIGDAAHVFPPFGGQGIACGIRDAHSLGWRLALLLQTKGLAQGMADEILNRWSLERKLSVYDSAKTTTVSGALCNEEDEGAFYAFRQLVWLISRTPGVSKLITADIDSAHRSGCSAAKGGFHLRQFSGGVRMPQVFVQSSPEKSFLSDQLLHRNTALTLFIIDEYPEQLYTQVGKLIEATRIHPNVLAPSSIVLFQPTSEAVASFDTTASTSQTIYRPASRYTLNAKIDLQSYDENAFTRCLGKSAKYVIVRPDFMVFACATSYAELQLCLRGLKQRLYQV